MKKPGLVTNFVGVIVLHEDSFSLISQSKRAKNSRRESVLITPNQQRRLLSAHVRELRKICSKRGKMEDAFAVFQRVSFFVLSMSFSVNFLKLTVYTLKICNQYDIRNTWWYFNGNLFKIS